MRSKGPDCERRNDVWPTTTIEIKRRGTSAAIAAPDVRRRAASGAPPPDARIVDEASVPRALSEHLRELEDWAIQNKLDARKDLAAFWILKIPAILSSASAGILGHFS